jgi:hypothetical protein
MLTLTPRNSRTAYVAWYVIIAGVVTSFGALLGGGLQDALQGLHARIADRIPVGGFQVVVLLCFGVSVASSVILSRIREGREKPVGFLLSALMTPQIFRTFLTINVLGRGEACPADTLPPGGHRCGARGSARGARRAGPRLPEVEGVRRCR